MTQFAPESVDLSELSRSLRSSLGEVVVGEVVGRTVLRDEVIARYSCSMLEAERVVDTLIALGWVVRDQSLDGQTRWRFRSELR